MCDEEYQTYVCQFTDVVYRTALNATKSYHDAQDNLQNTFFKLLQTDMLFQDENHIRRWLIRVALNESRNLKKSYWKRMVEPVEDLSDRASVSGEPNNDLYERVMTIPPKYRMIIHLFYYEDYSILEIANLLHVNAATIRTRLCRGRKILKKLILEDI